MDCRSQNKGRAKEYCLYEACGRKDEGDKRMTREVYNVARKEAKLVVTPAKMAHSNT